LTGSNLFFAAPGAVLDVVGATLDDALLAAWRARIGRAAARLGWHAARAVARPHAGGMQLAISAPEDQLYLATEVNEWALCAALEASDPAAWSHLEAALAAAAPDASIAPVIEESAALARFGHLQETESAPALQALLALARDKSLPYAVDETEVTFGAGSAGRSYPIAALPDLHAVPWAEIRAIPTAIVTGSNGKTTTVRLLAACARAHGWHAGYNCTDGVYLDDEALASGDYSGPAGARMVMRDRRAQAAILETARGGILRRGIAVARADTAVVTNISSDHFGEYGIDDLAGLADVKLSVAAVIDRDGLLVLNADNALLLRGAQTLVHRFGRQPPLGWFALDAEQPLLREHRLRGGSTCGAHGERMLLHHRGEVHDLGRISAMPLSIGGVAAYNIANLAAAALAASAIGIGAAAIAEVFARFGRDVQDNPGRMMRFEIDGAQVLIDYAHNPDGLRGFLAVADRLRSKDGRLGLLLGHAGNRKDDDIEALARTAADFRPDLIVVKENDSQLRGRAPGEVPGIIRRELLRLGFPDAALPMCDTELDAARYALHWARPGDVLALPLHGAMARAAVVALLENRAVHN
jgi:UDP-N-acetylmuramyl tripeptide synthase